MLRTRNFILDPKRRSGCENVFFVILKVRVPVAGASKETCVESHRPPGVGVVVARWRCMSVARYVAWFMKAVLVWSFEAPFEVKNLSPFGSWSLPQLCWLKKTMTVLPHCFGITLMQSDLESDHSSALALQLYRQGLLDTLQVYY